MSTVSVLSRDPPVYLLENFLNATEIAHVRALGIERLAPSEGVGTTAAETLEYRSSSSEYFSPAQSRIVEAIEERALRVTGAPLLEPLQVVQYVRGQRYDAHFDYFDQLPGSAAAISVHGQRTHTLFVYLDSVPAAGEGETSFPLLAALRVHPRRGAALLWSNVLPSGVEDARTLHAGLPVVGDFVKIAMNVWTTDSVLVGPVVPCPPPPPSAPIDEV
jgi:prolyl 4-hydroxylase